MIRHVVLFHFPDDRSDAAQEVCEALRGMAGRVPSLAAVEAGVNVSESARAYDLALIATFASLEDLEAYRVHPVHQEVVARIQQLGGQTLVVDFEL